MERLSEQQVSERLAGLPGWELVEDAITREFDRGDFVGSVEFVKAIVAPAEEMNHHPDLAISWSTVTVTITTHSAGGLTENDFVLARRIDELA